MGILLKSSKKLRSYTMELQLTSMIDMFTILLVFLLKSYSVEQTNVLVSKDLRLPISTAKKQPNNILNIIVSQDEVLVDGDLILPLSKGKIHRNDLSSNKLVIRPLFDALNKRRIFQEQSAQSYFKGKIILQADRLLDYDTLHKVIYTAGEAGYPKFKFLVLNNED